MSKNSYSEKLKDPRWQKKRLKILDRDNWCCTCCADNESELQVHHLKYSGNPWEIEDELLTTLCVECHSKVSNREFLKEIRFEIINNIKDDMYILRTHVRHIKAENYLSFIKSLS
jgi:5-methylcytosine-specific restriction endonuclease McrA